MLLSLVVPAHALGPPTLIGALSRKVHGAAGTFDLPLVGAVSNPTTEPRLGPSHSIVFTFDDVVTAGSATVTEGAATSGVPVFNGNELIVPLTGVSNAQYVTVAVSGVSTAGGASGGSGSARIGFLAGDVNHNRVVTVADVGLVNAQLAQLVTASNYFMDVNASGTLTVGDKGVVNGRLTTALPPPVDAAPSVVSTVPAANASNVSPTANVTIQFSEPVAVTGAWFQMACTSGTRTPANTAVSGDLAPGSGTTFTIDPNVDFATDDACTVTIFASAVSDLDLQDPPDQMAADYVFTFGVHLGGLFEKPLPWNTDVSALTPSSRSGAIIAALNSFGGWGNGNKMQIDFAIALLNADSTTARRTITASPGGYCYHGPDCDAVPLQMPIPANGNTEGSANYNCDTAHEDCHVLVVEHTEKKLYELYNATASGSNFTALGAFVWDLTKQYTDVLRGDQCTSADAAGLPMAALLVTSDEVAAGEVPHALRFILPNDHMKASVYVHPATHAGGPSSSNANAPPYGVHFRLKASFDETPFNASARVILHAMKKYGMILSDGGSIALTFGDDRLSTAKWDTLGIDSHTFFGVAVSDFEVVNLGSEIGLTDDCVRAP
jgi:Bacterial Ig-like domain